MNTNLLWKGKGPIVYDVDIYGPDEQQPNPSILEESGWKYTLYISGAGPYADAYLGNDTEDFGFFADTKEGVIRDLAAYIDNQITDKTARKGMGMPSELLNLKNVAIYDRTNNNDFAGIDVPAIFTNAKILSDISPPPGERPFIAIIRDNVDTPSHYDISITTMDPVVIEELENTYYDYDSNNYYDVPAQDVLETIRDDLSTMDLKYNGTEISPDNTKLVNYSIEILPNINNTKLVNYTDNPEFTLSRLYSITTPLQITRKPPTLKLPKTSNTVEPSTMQNNIPLPAPIKEQPKKKQTKAEEEKERLRA